jgi:hypothetical protein
MFKRSIFCCKYKIYTTTGNQVIKNQKSSFIRLAVLYSLCLCGAFGCSIYKSEDRKYVESNAAQWLQLSFAHLPVTSETSDDCGANFPNKTLKTRDWNITHAGLSLESPKSCDFYSHSPENFQSWGGSCWFSQAVPNQLPSQGYLSLVGRTGSDTNSDSDLVSKSTTSVQIISNTKTLLTLEFTAQSPKGSFYYCRLMQSLAPNSVLAEAQRQQAIQRGQRLARALVVSPDSDEF